MNSPYRWRFKRYTITLDPKPIPDRRHDFTVEHPDDEEKGFHTDSVKSAIQEILAREEC